MRLPRWLRRREPVRWVWVEPHREPSDYDEVLDTLIERIETLVPDEHLRDEVLMVVQEALTRTIEIERSRMNDTRVARQLDDSKRS